MPMIVEKTSAKPRIRSNRTAAARKIAPHLVLNAPELARKGAMR